MLTRLLPSVPANGTKILCSQLSWNLPGVSRPETSERVAAGTGHRRVGGQVRSIGVRGFPTMVSNRIAREDYGAGALRERLGHARMLDLSQPSRADMPVSTNQPAYSLLPIRRRGDIVRSDGGSAISEVIVTGAACPTRQRRTYSRNPSRESRNWCSPTEAPSNTEPSPCWGERFDRCPTRNCGPNSR